MKLMRIVDWEYALIQGDEGRHFIDVVCGTIGPFTRRVELTLQEYEQSLSDDGYLRKLIQTIRDRPLEFDGRYFDNPSDAFGYGWT